MIKNRSTTRLGYLLIAATTLLMGWVISFAIYAHQKNFGSLQIEFPKTGTLVIENDFTVFGNHYGKITNIENTPTGEAIVTVKLKKPLTIYQGYHAYVYDVGLFGKRAICLENGPKSTATVNTKHPIKGTYYPGIADILGSMYKMKVAFEELQKVVHNAYGDDPKNARIIMTIHNIKEKTDAFTELLNTFLPESETTLPETIVAIQKKLSESDSLLNKTENFSSKLTELDTTTLKKANQLLYKVEELDSSLYLIASQAESTLDSINSYDLEKMQKKLTDISQLLENIGNDTHKLKLKIRRYNAK